MKINKNTMIKIVKTSSLLMTRISIIVILFHWFIVQ